MNGLAVMSGDEDCPDNAIYSNNSPMTRIRSSHHQLSHQPRDNGPHFNTER